MQTVVSLLTQALSLCSSKRDLARRLGCSEQNLQALMKGARHLTTAQAIALANMTGIPPAEVLAVDAIEREKDPEERGRFREAFFRRGIVGGAAIMIICGATATSDARAATPGQLVMLDNLYIVASRLRRWITTAAARAMRTVGTGLHPVPRGTA